MGYECRYHAQSKGTRRVINNDIRFDFTPVEIKEKLKCISVTNTCVARQRRLRLERANPSLREWERAVRPGRSTGGYLSPLPSS
eukprot:6179436-Pleurochrysis_carterae.AAC.1